MHTGARVAYVSLKIALQKIGVDRVQVASVITMCLHFSTFNL